MNETPDGPRLPDEDRRGQQNDSTATDPLGEQPPPPGDEADDELQEPRPRGMLSGRRLAAGVAVLVLLAGGAALALSGDGGGGGGSASSSGDDLSSREEAAFEFADCMRDNGLEDFPDPEVGADGGVSFQAPEEQLDTEAFKAAEEACQPILDAAAPEPPEGVERLTPEEHAELQDKWLVAAQCVRDRGYDFADPEIDEYGRFRHVDANGQGIEQAIEDCLVEAGVRDEGAPQGEEESP